VEINSFYIETYGCTSNKSDSYIISSLLKGANYRSAALESAQFIIINTCAVKQQTENKIKQRLKVLYEDFRYVQNKYFIIAGCLPHIAENYINIIKNIIPNFSAILDLDNIHQIVEIFEEIKKGRHNLIYTSENRIDKASYLINYGPNKITGIVPISQGCLGRCTYCCTKNARGTLKCYDPKHILRNVQHQLKQGIKQIYLTSQDCSIYQFENVELLHIVRQISELPYKFFLRIGMINPSFLIDNLDHLIEIFTFPLVYQFLHVPIQSGSDEVLKNMNRTYTISDILTPLKKLKDLNPFMTISTDIICGFPTETEEDFKKTMELIQHIKPEILNISKFTPRPGTAAKNMKQLHTKTIKERSFRLSDVFKKSLLEINKKWMGWKGEVLVLHEGAQENQAFGRNFAYKNIFIEDYLEGYGNFVEIEITKIDGFNLFGKLR